MQSPYSGGSNVSFGPPQGMAAMIMQPSITAAPIQVICAASCTRCRKGSTGNCTATTAEDAAAAGEPHDVEHREEVGLVAELGDE